jgi:hypothetical protein
MKNNYLPPVPFDLLVSNVEQIKLRYNPENDAGNVTWCDMRLIETINILVAHIAAQHNAISELIAVFNDLRDEVRDQVPTQSRTRSDYAR